MTSTDHMIPFLESLTDGTVDTWLREHGIQDTTEIDRLIQEWSQLRREYEQLVYRLLMTT